MTSDAIQAEVILGDGAAMYQVPNGRADLVLTSPPYFPDHLEPELRRPFRSQAHVDEVAQQVTSFALSLRPVFSEIARVLSSTGKLVIQTRDLRYGGYLIGPADTHRRLAETDGFHLMTEISWTSTYRSRVREQVTRALWQRGEFVTDDVEKFLVLTRASLVSGVTAPALHPPPELADTLWRTATQGARRTHRHESPMPVVRRLIELYSRPGDLVVDPFCGHGTTMVAAVRMERNAIGYDIDADCVEMALERLSRTRTTAAKAGGR